ncbi:MAG: ABC transporter permease [Verrucomicrobiota bacterium]
MSTPPPSRWIRWGLDQAPVLLVVLVLFGFGRMSDRFLTADNLMQILLQAAAPMIVATGMTFVLLTAGVDLSVGAVMFVGAAIAGKLAVAGHAPALCFAAMLAVGLLGGGLNALLVTRLRLAAFIATLAMLFIGRGLGRWITQTRAMNLPDTFLEWGSARLLGIPVPVFVAAGVALAAQLVLSRTPFGRQVLAFGNNPEAAHRAGVRTHSLQAAVYVLCGGCAALGGIVALTQLGSVSPRFGEQYEFEAITAAVLGGTSLFGGRGRVFPGTALGAILLKGIFSGLVILQADPYLYPLITAVIIFIAVLIDSLRTQLLRI